MIRGVLTEKAVTKDTKDKCRIIYCILYGDGNPPISVNSSSLDIHWTVATADNRVILGQGRTGVEHSAENMFTEKSNYLHNRL